MRHNSSPVSMRDLTVFARLGARPSSVASAAAGGGTEQGTERRARLMTPEERHTRFVATVERGEQRVRDALAQLRAAPRRNAGSDLRQFVGGTSRRTGRPPDGALERVPDDRTLDLAWTVALRRRDHRGDEAG